MQRQLYQPMLLQPTSSFPEGSRWLHEVKFNGHRVLAYNDLGIITLRNAKGENVTEEFAVIARALLGAFTSARWVVDGSIVALNPRGHPDHSLLATRKGVLVYQVFDLLELNEESCISLPLTERKAKLHELYKLKEEQKHKRIFLVQSFETADVEGLRAELAKFNLTEVACKRKGAPYECDKRGWSWLKFCPEPP